ncbi:ninjurin-1 [Fopius arisanus]|uniref:Ninj1_1 protein n=1 Tax=Fopius arisanus TaxID=64838 RepID=A0A0C9QMJ0_9HYME|nr:PREDICTED: ninjurin-1-like [Fopius arisanus]
MAKGARLPPEITGKQISRDESNLNPVIERVLDEIELEEKELHGIDLEVQHMDMTDKGKRTRLDYTYSAKKTVAQGMMDVALITANANQLRYLVEYQRESPTFWFIVFLIAISLSLQIAVGVSLIFKGRFDIKGKSKSPQARRINNYVVVGVFLITIINVFVAAFSITSPPVGGGNSVVNNAPV